MQRSVSAYAPEQTPSLREKRLPAHPASKQAQAHVTSTISVAATAAHE